MGLPASKIGICNMALDHIGQPPISSIDPGSTPTEILVARHYDAVRQSVLRKYVWNFAKKRATITRSGDAEFDFTDKYTLPNDFVRLLSVEGSSGEISQSNDYDINGREIYINASTADSINIRYVSDVEDVTTWDALFRQLVILNLALVLAFAITKKESVVKRINDMLALETPSAISIDGQEVPPRRIQKSRIITSRRLGTASVASPYTEVP